VDTLPTLSSVAMRALALCESDADMSEIAQVIESDPSLTLRILAECRRADKGMSNDITSVRQAIVMLGLDSVRSALLSVEVYEAIGKLIESRPGDDGSESVNPRELVLVDDSLPAEGRGNATVRAEGYVLCGAVELGQGGDLLAGGRVGAGRHPCAVPTRAR